MRGVRLVVVVASLVLFAPSADAQTADEGGSSSTEQTESKEASDSDAEASESSADDSSADDSDSDDSADDSDSDDSADDSESADASDDGEDGKEGEDGDDGDDGTESDELESSSDWSSPGKFAAGDLDIGVALSGNIFYPYFEPMVDFGAVPMGDDLTLGVGGVVGYGFCLLCAGISAGTNVQFSSSNWVIQGRGLVHINSVGESLDQPLDLYVGAGLGPTFYTVKLSDNDTSAEVRATATGIRFTPLVGARFVFGGGPFFFGVEGRWDIEFVQESVVLDGGDNFGVVRTYNASQYSRRGLDLILTLGARL